MTCEGRHQIVVGGGSAGCVVASRLAEDVDQGRWCQAPTCLAPSTVDVDVDGLEAHAPAGLQSDARDAAAAGVLA